MPIQWHHTNQPPVAFAAMPPTPQGRLQVPFQGLGQYLFYVDHRPHDNRLLTTFAGVRVTAVFTNGQMSPDLPFRHDRFGDRNACVWEIHRRRDIRGFIVNYQLTPHSLRQVRPGTGFTACAKWAPLRR